jgi:uncharacterized membrane protein
MSSALLMTIFFSVLPISELRGAIPYAVYNGFSVPIAALISMAANISVPIIAFIFLETLHKLFYKIPQYQKFFDKFVENERKKLHSKVEKYG